MVEMNPLFVPTALEMVEAKFRSTDADRDMILKQIGLHLEKAKNSIDVVDRTTFDIGKYRPNGRITDEIIKTLAAAGYQVEMDGKPARDSGLIISW